MYYAHPIRSDARRFFLLTTFNKSYMVNYDFVKEKRWREFVSGIRYGEVAQFSASPSDVACLRTIAGRINTEDGLDYVYAVESNSESGRCQVYTKPRL